VRPPDAVLAPPTGVCRFVALSTDWPCTLAHRPVEQEPWIHADPVSRGVGRPRRGRGTVPRRSRAHHRSSGGNSGTNNGNNFRNVNNADNNHAAHRRRRDCGRHRPRGISPELRLAVVPSTGGPSSLRTAEDPVVIRAPGRRPVGSRRPGGAERRRRRGGLLGRDRGPRRHHREPFRWAAHDLRAGRPTVGIRDCRASGRPDRDDLLSPRTLRTDHLPSLGRRRRADLPRSLVAAGTGPANSAAPRLRWCRTASVSGARMRLKVGTPQPLHRDVCIDLRGGQAGVTEHLLHRAKIGAALEQVGRRAVP
jgi:hypothetical protein